MIQSLFIAFILSGLYNRNMESKANILLIAVVIIALAGAFWYFNQDNSQGVGQQTASLVGEKEENSGGELPSSGILLSQIDGDYVLGSPEAPVTMIEYSSHICGHCVDFHLDNFPAIIEKYVKTGKVKVITRLLSSPELATAVLCAHEQGNFHEFNEYLFEHISEIKSVDDIESMAGESGLDQDKFNQCYDLDRFKDEIIEWYNQASSQGVSGTPYFFINDQKIVGNQPLEVFESAIENALNNR